MPMRAMLVLLATLAGAGAVRADSPLAGELLVADTHGQPFCRTKAELQRYLLATIQHDRLPAAAFAGCVVAPYATRVRMLQDLPPYGSRMHVLRAVAMTPLQRIEGFTYSVGLYDARRFAPFSPTGDTFPRVP